MTEDRENASENWKSGLSVSPSPASVHYSFKLFILLPLPPPAIARTALLVRLRYEASWPSSARDERRFRKLTRNFRASASRAVSAGEPPAESLSLFISTDQRASKLAAFHSRSRIERQRAARVCSRIRSRRCVPGG